MKNIIEAIKKEPGDIVFWVVAIVAVNFFEPLIEVFEWSYGLSISYLDRFHWSIFAILMLCVLGVFFYDRVKYVTDDFKAELGKMDEREALHEYEVATTAYRSLVTALYVLLIFRFDLLLLTLLIFAFAVRILKRVSIERQGR